MSDSVLTADSVPPASSKQHQPATREVWIERFKRFGSAGLSVVEFCRTEGVAPQGFYYWRKKLAHEPSTAATNGTPRVPPQFLSVRLTTETAPIELVLPTGAVLRLRPGCDLHFVGQLLAALGVTPC